MAGVSTQTKYPRRQPKVWPTFTFICCCDKHYHQKQLGDGRVYLIFRFCLTSSGEAKAGASAAQGSRVRICSRGHGGASLLTCFPWPFQITLLSNHGPPAEGWHCPPVPLTNQQHALLLCLQASLMETIFNASSFFADDSDVCQIDKT